MLSRLWGAVQAAAPLGTHSSAGPARGRAANRSDLDQAPMAVRQRAVRRKTFTIAWSAGFRKQKRVAGSATDSGWCRTMRRSTPGC